MKNNPYDIQGKMDKAEVLKMLYEIHQLCKEIISQEHSIDYDTSSWTLLQFAESEINDSKARLISKNIQRQYVLKLLYRIFSIANDVTPESKQMVLEIEFGKIIEQYGFDIYLLIVGCTKKNWFDSKNDSKIPLHFINFRETKMSEGNGMTNKQLKKYYNKQEITK